MMTQDIQYIKSYYDKLISENVRKYEAAARALTIGIDTFVALVQENSGRMPASKFTELFDINSGTLHAIMLGVYGYHIELNSFKSRD